MGALAVKAVPIREKSWPHFKKAFEQQYQPPALVSTRASTLYTMTQDSYRGCG